MSFALATDYIVVTNNRRHFLKEYIKVDLHNGSIIIVPSVERGEQIRLFELALDAVMALGSNLVNRLVEAHRDGSVEIRSCTRDDHDIGHINEFDRR